MVHLVHEATSTKFTNHFITSLLKRITIQQHNRCNIILFSHISRCHKSALHRTMNAEHLHFINNFNYLSVMDIELKPALQQVEKDSTHWLKV